MLDTDLASLESKKHLEWTEIVTKLDNRLRYA